MGAKLSGSGQQAFEALEEARRKWDRVRALVEQAAGARTGQDMYVMMIGRAARDIRRVFLSAGQGTLADQCNELATTVRRGGRFDSKLRTLRELVAKVDGGIERAVRQVVRADRGTSDKEEDE